MEYKQIEAFIAIAELKNITKAADTLFVSQSALSYRLKTLEEEVGVTLVTRNKGIASHRLTAKGEEFLSIAREWQAVYRKALGLQHPVGSHYDQNRCPGQCPRTVFQTLYTDYRREQQSTVIGQHLQLRCHSISHRKQRRRHRDLVSLQKQS